MARVVKGRKNLREPYSFLEFVLDRKSASEKLLHLCINSMNYHIRNESPVQVPCRMQEAWGWCTGITQRDGMGREVGGEFRMGNTCAPVVDSC